jgi:hypothetical protein
VALSQAGECAPGQLFSDPNLNNARQTSRSCPFETGVHGAPRCANVKDNFWNFAQQCKGISQAQQGGGGPSLVFACNITAVSPPLSSHVGSDNSEGMPRARASLRAMLQFGHAPQNAGCPQRLLPFSQVIEPSYRVGYSCQNLHNGGSHTIRIIIDTVLFSCMGAFITGIVVAAATFIS